MAHWEWSSDGNGRQTYKQVDNAHERAQSALRGLTDPVIPFPGLPDQHDAGPELADGTTATTITITGDEVPSAIDDTPHGRLRRFLYLSTRKKTLEAETKAVKAELSDLNRELQDTWGEDGVSRVTLDGITAYLYPVSHVEKVGDATPADIRDALHRSGLGYMLEPNYSAPALKAYLKELDSAGREVPTPLAAVVTLITNQEIRLRAATASTRRAQD